MRSIRFVRRSALPVSAACVIANGVRETLAATVGAEVAVRLYPPSLPTPRAWDAILQDARIYRLAGPAAEAVVILRLTDALALAVAAFGETDVRGSALSHLEGAALDRTIAVVAAQFGAVCGGTPQIERIERAGALATFFEIEVERPVQARIGVGLRSYPASIPQAALTVDDLADIRIKTHVNVDLGRFPAAYVAALEPGDVLSLGRGLQQAVLLAAGRTLALGECGVSGSRYAFAVKREVFEGSKVV